MNTKYYTKASKISELFSFVLDYGLKLEREETFNYGSYVEYIGNGIKLSLGFDFKDYFFYFKIFKGLPPYPPENSVEREEVVKTFWDVFNNYSPKEITQEELQPNEEKGYLEALELNAELLKKYGDKILKGEEWF